MKEEIKNPENAMKYNIQRQWKGIVPVVRKTLQTQNSGARRPKQCLHQIVLFVVRKTKVH